MTLIKSISGIRGTIGGPAGSGLTPFDIVKYTCAYCEMLRKRRPHEGRYKVVVGKDARISGKMVEDLVCGTITACGIDVIKAGKASTPTTEMAVVFSGADGGIILTASSSMRRENSSTQKRARPYWTAQRRENSTSLPWTSWERLKDAASQKTT